MGRIYAIGDIHGRLDLLERAIAAIDRDVETRGPAELTVTLGDYIDRGPSSCGVIERLLTNPFPTPHVALKGNHEQVLEQFLVDPGILAEWRTGGALETLHSYRVPVADAMMGRNYEAASKALVAALPEAHRDFIAGLKTSHLTERYFFCHAGVRPGIPFAAQSDDDLMWIRHEFLSSEQDFGRRVVHGHTPVAEPEVRTNRINIDTGAFATGRLTCIALEGDRHRFLKV
ncbi:MAG: serine/threonine protein phosphatase [Proteobacteria bacterium]|nr:serine/threonine protein phosphatase [Pseudomonadota bacterium]